MYHLKDQLFRSVFNQLPDPATIFLTEGEQQELVLCNKALEKAAGIKADDLRNRAFSDYLNLLNLNAVIKEELKDAVHSVISMRTSRNLQPFYGALGATNPVRRWWRCELSFVERCEESSAYLMLSFKDLTDLLEDNAPTGEETPELKIRKFRRLSHELLEENTTLQNENNALSESNSQLEELNTELSESNRALEEHVNQATEQVRRRDRLMRMMLVQAPVAIAVLEGPEMRIESANAAILSIWRRDSSILGMPLLEAMPELRDQPYPALLQHVYESGQPYIGSEASATIGKDNQTGYFNFVYQPLKDSSGETFGIIVMANNVTELVISRRRVEQSAQRVTSMVMNTPMAMTILKGEESIVEIANEAMLSLWGRSKEDVVGRKLLDLFPELMNQQFPALLKQVFSTGKRISQSESQVEIVSGDQSTRNLYVSFSYDPIFDEAGKVESVLATVQDVTEITEARHMIEERNHELETLHEELMASNEDLFLANEQLSKVQDNLNDLLVRLAESESLFRQVFDQAPVGICLLTGPDQVISMANDTILSIWGRTAEETIGKPHAIARPELNDGPYNEWLKEVYETGKSRLNRDISVNFYTGEGKPLRQAYATSLYQPFYDVDGKIGGIIAILTDNTEEVRARKESDRAREKLRLAVELADMGTWYLDLKDNKMIASDRLKHLLGYDAEDELDLEDGILSVDADYREGVRAAIAATIELGHDHDIEFPVTGVKNGRKRWLKSSGRRFLDNHGEPSYFSGTIIDITGRKLEEIKKNDFIAIVSHELKTPLTSLKAYLQLLHSKQNAEPGDSFIKSALKKSLNQIDKMNILVKGFLDVSRLENGAMILDKTNFSLNKLLDAQVDDMLLLASSHSIGVEHDCQIDVYGDREKIAQVTGNLLSNAMKYSPAGTSIRVRCQREGNMAVVSVKDQGIGIQEADLKKVFDRFYRVENAQTKTIAGFGIGLYLCSEIISRHNGKIWAESKKNDGTIFYFALPLTDIQE